MQLANKSLKGKHRRDSRFPFRVTPLTLPSSIEKRRLKKHHVIHRTPL
jgi:hypothetical protein